MKKILAGMFFRLFKSVEIWGLLVLLLVTYAAMFSFSGSEVEFLGLVHDGGTVHVHTAEGDFDVTEDNVKQYCFESLDVSAFDVYRAEAEILPAEVMEKLNSGFNYYAQEREFLIKEISALHAIPAILMVIFIPMFFGRLYSDGTMKNLIACGYSKAQIYLSSLLVIFVIDFVLIILEIIVLVAGCLILSWHPPVYLPVVLTYILVELLILFTMTAICFAVLFASAKKTAAYIVGFLLSMSFLFMVPVSTYAIGLINIYDKPFDYESEGFKMYRQIMQYDPYGAEEEFDLSEFDVNIVYKGRKVDMYGESKMSPELKNTLLTVTYLDPMLIPEIVVSVEISPYLVCRDGLAAICCAVNCFWIAAVSGIGIAVFRKREIQ